MKRITFILLTSSLLYASQPKYLPDEMNNIEIYRKANPSVVNITSVTLEQGFFFEIIPREGVGSGVIIKDNGYILTNNHVVGKASKLEVTLYNKKTFPAKIVGKDPDTDLAVIKINARDEKLSPIIFSSTDSLSVGQKVLAIGNPFGLGGSLSVGIISSLGRDIRTPSGRLIKDVIQTDAAINPGNSGGPLLDSSGFLIGINTQIISTSGGSEGIGFAISLKTVRKVTKELINFGRVRRPELGLYGIGFSQTLLHALEIPISSGIMITEIIRGSSADIAGLKAANKEVIFGFRSIPVNGDIIFRIDDTKVETFQDLLDYISDKKENDIVDIYFYRGKKRMSVKVRLRNL